jgi:tight adherence protein C
MQPETLLALGTFLGMALIVWVTLSAIAEKQSRAADRLERLVRASADRTHGPSELIRKQDRIQQLVSKAAPALSKPLQPKSEAELSKLRLELLNAGFRSEQAVQIFLGIKFASILLSLGIVIPLVMAGPGLTPIGMTQIAIVGGLGMYLPGIVLGVIRRKRQESIFLGLPDALDLMVVCVEAGLGLDAAMRRVASELAAATPVICEELAIANFQVQMGRPRRDVLHELGKRTGVDDVRALAAVLIQAERFGASIATALRVQSDSMRVKRRQLAEERAAKAAVKLILPLVLFIFPGIFVVLVGPAGIQIATTLVK